MAKAMHGFFRDSIDRQLADAALPTSVSGASRNGPVRRTLICEYPAGSFHAERSDDGVLRIYYIGSEPLTNMVEDKAHCGCGSSMDEGRMTAARLQERSVRLRATGR